MILQPFLTRSQQSIFTPRDSVNPQIHPDKSVTFKIKDSLAKEIAILGDWMPLNGFTAEPVTMKNDGKGNWTYTTEPLKSDMHIYRLIVDGYTTTDAMNPFVIRDVSTLYNVFLVPGGNADLYAVNDVSHGTVAERWYNSPGNNMQRRLTVYTPPGYENSDQKYPVLYLLHGAGGDETAWMTLGRATQILDNLIAQGKARPMIMIMPNGNVSQQAAPGEGIKGYYQPQFIMPKTMDGTYEETFTDIMKFVAENYRIMAGKENTAIAGLSMGGYHSLHISRYYPNTFNYIGLFSAATLPTKDKKSIVYENIDETLIRQKENGYALYWIGMGKDDFLYKSGKQYTEKLDSLKMPYEYHESEGGHIWSNWRDYLIIFLQKIFK